MAGFENSDSLRQIIRERIINKFRIPEFAVLAILNALSSFFIKWEKVPAWPVFPPLIALPTQNLIPRANPKLVSFFIRLENRAHHKNERLIIESFDTIRLDIIPPISSNGGSNETSR